MLNDRTQAHAQGKENRKDVDVLRSGNARALLHRQSGWQKGYFVLATQSARVLLPQLLCVCRLLWRGRQDVAATPGSNGAAKAPQKKKKTDVVASPGLSPKLPEKRWRGERASERIVGRPFRLLSPQSLGPSVSGGPGCPVQPLPPTWPLAVNSLAKRAPPPVQSRSTCRVCARASRAFTDPIVVFSHGDDDRNRSTAEFASGGIVQRDWFASRGPVAPRASSVAVQVRQGGVAGAEVHSRCVAYKQALPAAAAAIFDSVMLCPVRSLLCVASRLGERNLAGKLGVVGLGHLA